MSDISTKASFGAQIGDWLGTAIQGAASMLGLGDKVKSLAKKWANADSSDSAPDETELINTINSLIAKAQAKGSAALNSLNNALASMPTNVSPTIKSHVTKAIQTAKSNINKQIASNAKVDALASKATQYASSYDAASAGDFSTGKAQQYASKALSAAQQALANAGDVTAVETKIGGTK